MHLLGAELRRRRRVPKAIAEYEQRCRLVHELQRLLQQKPCLVELRQQDSHVQLLAGLGWQVRAADSHVEWVLLRCVGHAHQQVAATDFLLPVVLARGRVEEEPSSVLSGRFLLLVDEPRVVGLPSDIRYHRHRARPLPIRAHGLVGFARAAPGGQTGQHLAMALHRHLGLVLLVHPGLDLLAPRVLLLVLVGLDALQVLGVPFHRLQFLPPRAHLEQGRIASSFERCLLQLLGILSGLFPRAPARAAHSNVLYPAAL
mmetsp:Transcript_63538/g.182454  ORF Transcript_63538/g.182454 Transcript_63538/m.182454 type:complete len:258 (+) Transcript_63538:1676-2449(+)